MDRNVILGAYLDLLEQSGKFKTVERDKIRLWGDVSKEERPYTAILSGRELRTQQAVGTPPLITLYVDNFIYINSDEVVPGGGRPLEYQLNLLDDILRPNALTNKLTLGGLVSHCWIEGETLKVPGDLDGEGLAVVPIRILVPE